jgi:hypothetical protein
MKFKSDIEVQAGLKDSSGAAGTSGQVLSSDGTAVSWIDAEIGVARDVQNRVKAGVAINKGQAVYVTGADGTNIIVGLASNASEATSSKTLGLLNATVATNGFADVVQIGKLTGLNTIGAIVGDPVWLGTNGNLIYGLANKPYAPAHLVYIGVVTRVNASNGEIFVTVQNGFELNEIHDVDLKTNTPISGDVLGYDGSLWVNKTIPGWLGYTPANDANVVKLTGNQTINGEKTFAGTIYSDNATYLKQYTSFSNQTDYTNISGQPGGIYIGTTSAASTISMTNLTAFRFYELPDASGTIALTSDIAGYVPYTGATSNVNLGSYSITANSFIKVGGNSTQYLKADGSVSTAMNSRIEVNFIATAGQTTFVTPYEVGQIDVYYNGSKLYPNEFTATNGTDVILATGATLNAQISIVKYVSSLSTTAIRNETTFTTTAGQTTFAVNYSPGQVDVFYNGSKLNISEFTATNGTSVVLGFACAAGESIVIDSYVNQISGASGTANYVSKFTGAASLGNSLIYDSGSNIGIGTIPTNYGSSYTTLDLYNANSGGYFIARGANVTMQLGVETTSAIIGPITAHPLILQTSALERLRINSVGNISIGTPTPLDGGSSSKWLTLNGSTYSGGIIGSVNGTAKFYNYYDNSSNTASLQGAAGVGASLWTDNTERIRITTNGTLAIIGNSDVNNAGLDKFSIGFNNGNYGWLQTWAGTSLYLNKLGNAVYAGTQRIDNNSDERIKENIVPIQGALDTVLLLQGKKYNMLDEDNILRYGFIAQEVQPHLSDFVTESDRSFEKDDVKIENLLTLESSGAAWAALLVEAIKEQNQQIQELKAEIEILKNK